jgi:signal transduction histidine kinase/CheY-like chemotaxis protein
VTQRPDGGDAQTELERLRRENAALDEQVKLLVLTEQRLYRSQNELDAQLSMVRALALFALESSMLEEPGATLARALEVLGSCFPIDWAGFVHPGAGPGELFVSAALDGGQGAADLHPIEPGIEEWLRSAPEAGWSELDPAAPAPCWRVLRVVAPALVSDGEWTSKARMAFVPVRGTDTRPAGVLLTVSMHARPAFMHGGALGERHLPYLSLLENHVDHALSNAHLTRRLHERSAELAQSVARLESTQQELLQAQKMEAIGRLAGGVAHDFNNLLTVILGYTGTLAASLPVGSPGHENLGKVTAAAQRAANLTRQLLALGRRQVQRREYFSLSEQCEHTVDLLRRLVGEDIRIELQLDRSLARVNADRTQLEQVLLNLIVNARDAMPQGGVLRIATRPATDADAVRCECAIDPAGFVVLEVADEGIGMDPVTLERIFEPFFTTKPSGQGTGLGLAVVYGVVKQSEGHILVDSEAGRGARFRVLLPIGVATDGAEPARAPAADESAAAPAGATVLVVEDEVAIRGVIRATLRRAGYVVLEATDGQDALMRILARQPDLVLTDILMPRMGGIALARELAIRHPGVRVAFMSGYAADFGEGTGAAEAFATFLPKPFTGEELRAFVARQLAGVVTPDARA